jgi:hypothetical protein
MDSSPYLTTDQFRKFFDTEFADLKQKYTSLMDQITQENTELKARVNDLTLENDQLKEQVNKLTANLNRGSSTTSSQTQNTPAFSTMASQWADEAKKQKVTQKQNKNIQNTQQKQYKTNQKTPKKKHFKPATEGMINWAYRGFTENTGPTGYQFIHFRNPARTNQRTVRKRLAIIGITNRRVLAVQFPTKGVTSLLVHNAYADAIKESLAKGKVTPINFDPLHESVICDPAHANLSVEQRQTMATDIYYNRMTKLCLAMKPSYIGSSIMRYFNQVQDQFHLPDDIVTKFFITRAASQQNTSPSAQPTQPFNMHTTVVDDLAEDDFMDSEEQQKQKQ